MSTFEFNGAHVTVGPVSGGFAQGATSGDNRFRVSGSLGAGFALNGFRFSVPCDCTAFEEGDHITVSSATLLLATLLNVRYSLCGGRCTGTYRAWIPGLGLGLSGYLVYRFGG